LIHNSDLPSIGNNKNIVYTAKDWWNAKRTYFERKVYAYSWDYFGYSTHCRVQSVGANRT